MAAIHIMKCWDLTSPVRFPNPNQAPLWVYTACKITILATKVVSEAFEEFEICLFVAELILFAFGCILVWQTWSHLILLLGQGETDVTRHISGKNGQMSISRLD